MQALTLLSLAVAAFASPHPIERRASGPSVTIQNGTVVGSSSGNVESFKGIPFAKPPVGSLRLKPPQTIDQSYGTIQTTNYATQCVQVISQVDDSQLPGQVVDALTNNPLLQKIQNSGEDCLYLNVQRPAGTNSSSNLPVAVWIYGGGFESGGTSTYDASSIVSRAIEIGGPFVYVSMAYRLSAFGFLAGKELMEDGSTNLGLRDQRKAMEWVTDNIAAFGGDPDRVTIWGESAGAISVFDQIIINRGNNKFHGHNLFHGAVMNSGSVVPANPVNSSKPQAVYDQVVKAAGCSGQADTLACLRSLSTEDFTDAAATLPGIFSYQSLDLSYLPRPDPSDDFFSVSPNDAVEFLNNSDAANIPILIGDEQDEGTLFSLVQENITNTDQLIDYIHTYYFPDVPLTQIERLVDVYPDSIPAGSPFDTGYLNNIYPEFKRLAAILGDITFTLTRRLYLQKATAAGIKAYTYLNTYFHGLPILGTAHGLDLVVLYGALPTANQVHPIDYLISFWSCNQDPNALSQVSSSNTSTKAVNWPQWTNSSRNMLEFAKLSTSLIRDDFREAQFDVINSLSNVLKI